LAERCFLWLSRSGSFIAIDLPDQGGKWQSKCRFARGYAYKFLAGIAGWSRPPEQPSDLTTAINGTSSNTNTVATFPNTAPADYD
jgi:hypothetical protein